MPRLSHCAGLARRHDPDRFAAALFAPAARQEALFALLAFNHEVAKTAEVVSEPLLGEIRLQWWSEALAELFEGRVRRHEVLEALAGPAAARRLEPAGLERILEARRRDLAGEPPADLDSLERYCEDTAAALLGLELGVLRDGEDGEEGEEGEGGDQRRRAVRQIGIAWALVGLLRALPFHARRRRLYLPADHLAAAGVEPGRIFAFESSDRLAGVVMRLANRASERLAEGTAAVAALPRRERAPLLIGRLARVYLKRLAAADYDPFDPRVAADLPQRSWLLAWAALSGRP